MSPANNSSLRILIVEDDPPVGTTLKLLLARGGFKPELVASAEEALALFEAGKFQLIITDYAMPGMKGDELATIIKSRSPAQPIIILTAYREKLEQANFSKADLILSKPFGALEFLETIKTLLNAGRAPQTEPALDRERNRFGMIISRLPA